MLFSWVARLCRKHVLVYRSRGLAFEPVKNKHVMLWWLISLNKLYLLYSLSARILHRAPPPRLQVDQNFLTQKIVADPKMRCHQKSFGIWRVTEAILGQKTCFFSKNIFWKKFIINLTIFLIFRYAFYRY